MDPNEVELLRGSVTGEPQNWDRPRANGWYACQCPSPPTLLSSLSRTGVLGLLGRDPARRGS